MKDGRRFGRPPNAYVPPAVPEGKINATEYELQSAGVSARPDTVLADAGYCHQDQMERLVAAGTQVLIAPDSSRRKGTRPGWDGGLYAFMRRIKFNRRIDRFHRRGRSAARAEWRLITATHNLLKLHKQHTAAATA
jgi:hypothetical protein